MARLEDISTDELEEALVDIEGYREVQRLLAAIIYKRGPSVPMLASWFDVREATIYRWFDRLETEPICDAIRDGPRPGRPSKLSEQERREFTAALQRPPRDVGYEASEWTHTLVRRYLQETFDVEYSDRHVRRLLSERDGT